MYVFLTIFMLISVPLQAQTVLNSNAKDPITIDAESVTYQLKEQTITFTGTSANKVKVTQTGRILSAKNLTAHLSDGGGLENLNATGGVTVQQNIGDVAEKATSSSAVYNLSNGTLVLEGNATITRGENVLRGEKLVYNLKDGTVKVTPKAGQRIRANLKPQ